MKRTERIGVGYVQSVVDRDLGWVFREQPTDDYGIDAHIEIADDTSPVGKLIAVQIKSGESYFKENSQTSIIFRFDSKHAEYWLNHSLPVIIILYNPKTHKCIWEHLQKDNIEFISGDKCKIKISNKQVFDINSKKALEEIANKQSIFERRYNNLLAAKVWMDELAEGNTLILEAEEWVNKSSGRGSMKLLLVDGMSGEEKSLVEWPFVMFPMQQYADVFPRIFPWADFSVDEDYYEEYETWRYQEEECHYDKEDDTYYPVGLSRQEWDDLQPRIRPYSNSAGEVDNYRLVMTLNEIGKAFLLLENHITQQQ